MKSNIRPVLLKKWKLAVLAPVLDRIIAGQQWTFVDVGLTNQGILLAVDLHTRGSRPNFEVADISNLQPGERVHLLYIVVDDVLNAYLNGELVVADFEVVDREGSYGGCANWTSFWCTL